MLLLSSVCCFRRGGGGGDGVIVVDVMTDVALLYLRPVPLLDVTWQPSTSPGAPSPGFRSAIRITTLHDREDQDRMKPPSHHLIRTIQMHLSPDT